MIRSVSSLLALLLFFCCRLSSIASAQEPSASDIDTARVLGHEALRALEHRDYAGAEERLDRALGLYRAPTLYLARGRARQGRGKFLAAAEDYRSVIGFPESADENPVFARARSDAREALGRAESQLSHLTLVAPSPLQRVSVNGVEWPADTLGASRPLDPGIYAIEATPPNGPARVYHVALAAGQTQQLTLEAEVARAEPAAVSREPERPLALASPTPRPAAGNADYTLAYVFGATTLGLVAGAIVTGVIALDRREDYEARNRPDVGLDEKQRLRRHATTWAWVNTGLWIGAVGAGAATAYTVFVAPAAPDRAGLQLVAAGRF